MPARPHDGGAERLRLGLIGAGWIAQTHVRSISESSAAVVCAVADVEPARARALAGRLGAQAYSSWTQMLDQSSGRLDAVLVCTPPQHHREPTVAALERGIPVYLEKPIARTQEDADAIVAAAERTGVRCAIGYQWHALAAAARIRGELSGQRLGLLVGRSIGPTTSRPWLLHRAQSGGQLLERASHHLDLQRMIAGRASTVSAHPGWVPLADRERPDGDIEDVISVELAYDGGARGAIHIAWLRSEIPGMYDMTIAASEALLTLTLDPQFTLSGVSRGHRIQQREDRPPAIAAMDLFLESLHSPDHPRRLCAPRDAAATLAVALACERSLRSGCPVEVGQPGRAETQS